MNINELIRYERKKNDFTLVKLAEKSGISYTKLVRIELGKIRYPKPDELRKIAAALNLQYESLMAAVGYKNSDESKSTATFNNVFYYKLTDFRESLELKCEPVLAYKKRHFLSGSSNLFGINLDQSVALFESFSELLIKKDTEKKENNNYMLYQIDENKICFSELKQFSDTWCFYHVGEEYEVSKNIKVLGSVIQVS